MLVALVVFIGPTWEQDGKIDYCFDDYSPHYIKDDKLRSEYCD